MKDKFAAHDSTPFQTPCFEYHLDYVSQSRMNIVLSMSLTTVKIEWVDIFFVEIAILIYLSKDNWNKSLVFIREKLIFIFVLICFTFLAIVLQSRMFRSKLMGDIVMTFIRFFLSYCVRNDRIPVKQTKKRTHMWDIRFSNSNDMKTYRTVQHEPISRLDMRQEKSSRLIQFFDRTTYNDWIVLNTINTWLMHILMLLNDTDVDKTMASAKKKRNSSSISFDRWCSKLTFARHCRSSKFDTRTMINSWPFVQLVIDVHIQ
jgi:hypothetical protein